MGGKIGALPPVSSLRVQTKQIALLQNFRSRTPQLVKGLLNNILTRKVGFHPDKLPAVQQALLRIMEVKEYKDLARDAYQTLFEPIKEVPVAPKPELPVPAPAVTQTVQLPPTEAEFYTENCPLETLLYVRATGKFRDQKVADSGMVKGYARSKIKERIENGSVTLDEIVRIANSQANTNIICGAIKTIGDLKPASISGKPAEAYLEGLRDLAPDSLIGKTAAAVLKDYGIEPAPPTLPPRPKAPVVTPPPAAADEVIKPAAVPAADPIEFDEAPKTIPTRTIRPVAETTPETVIKYLQDEVNYLVQVDADTRLLLEKLEQKSGELKKMGGERTKAVASLKAIIDEQAQLYKDQLGIAEANYKASINVEEIKKLQAQIEKAETEDLIQAAILKETMRIAVDPLREAYEEQKTQIQAKMNQALRLTERNAWISAQEREIATVKAEVDKLSAQIEEIKDHLAANRDDIRGLVERIDGYIKKLQVQKNSLLKILPKTEIGKKS
jgi:hypothetical protein